jgi:hypothetical protein
MIHSVINSTAASSTLVVARSGILCSGSSVCIRANKTDFDGSPALMIRPPVIPIFPKFGTRLIAFIPGKLASQVRLRSLPAEPFGRWHCAQFAAR